MIQNENHLYCQNTELQEYVSQYGIVIESWYHDVFDFELTEEDMQRIFDLDRQERYEN